MKPTPFNDIAHLMGFSTRSSATVLGVAVDSRLLKRGDLFFALPGAQVDGHTFIQEVAQKGASGAVVNNEYAGPDFGLPLIRVPDCLKALQDLSRTVLSKTKLRLVAVTGSVGKTTTKDFIAGLLKTRFNTSVSPGNSNSQIGLPLSILNSTDLEGDILILEMGMTHPGQISQLVEIAPPQVAVVTTVALVHACNFNSIDDIAKAKGEIFSHPCTKLGIYHKESDYEAALSHSGSCAKKSFSTSSEEVDLALKVVENGYLIKERGQAEVVLPRLKVLGEHNRHNFLAAVAVARHFGMTWEQIRQAQTDLVLPERRLEEVRKFGALFINDSYNATELSVKAALDALPKPEGKGKRIAVLGEMLELGKFSQACHLAVGKHALERVDAMYCFGEGCVPIAECWQAAGRPVVWKKERSEIIPLLRQELRENDVVLLKGSRSKGVWKVLEEL